MIVEDHGPIVRVMSDLSYSRRTVVVPVKRSDLRHYTPRTESSKNYLIDLKERFGYRSVIPAAT